jgi:DNA repair protein RecN (Recombination protein N)
MLLSLRLRDFVIVDEAEIEFGAGFTALTGETGAGKSILLDALGLTLGSRADSGMVREGATRADLSASFRSAPELDAWLADRDLAGDPGLVLLRRIVEADGRSRALINGQPTTVAMLREIGERLVDIHGQHASQLLLRAGAQRDLLDAMGTLDGLREEVASHYSVWQNAERQLAQARQGGREIELERERLLWQIGEIDKLDLAEGEWEALNAEQKRLAHAATLLSESTQAAEALADGDTPISSQLADIASRLKPLAELDPRLLPAVELIDTALIQIDEASSELSAYARRIDLDPDRLTQVEERIGAAFAAARKLRLAPEALARELGAMRERMGELTRAQDVVALERAQVAAGEAYQRHAQVLSTARQSTALELGKNVSALLGQLSMGGARLEIGVEPGTAGASGIDDIEFRIAGHSGTGARPLARVASGGELSRVGLAIAVLAAQSNPVPTLIFDEADAGVGGAVAEVIGSLMRKLGTNRQVLCVTHLPQVAARAHQQLRVSRVPSEHGVSSRVQQLSRSDRVEEIARMLGGVDITATTRKHAREMLASAAD